MAENSLPPLSRLTISAASPNILPSVPTSSTPSSVQKQTTSPDKPHQGTWRPEYLGILPKIDGDATEFQHLVRICDGKIVSSLRPRMLKYRF